MRRRLRRGMSVALFIAALPGLVLIAPFLGLIMEIDLLLSDDWWRG